MKKKSMTPSESKAFVESLSKYVLAGKYKEGLPVAKQALKQFPDDLICQYQYAKLLGDWADELPPAKKKKLKLEASRILKPLTRRLRGVPAEMRFGLCLNYYYQSSAFKDMYNFGKRFTATIPRKGLYAQALGAGLLAEHLYLSKDRGLVQQWAKKSAIAWQKYGLAKEPYYFAHYSYAKSLALLGESSEAMKSLKIAARLSKRPLTDWEFQDVLAILGEDRE